jgi:hypothetical protein
MLKLKLALISVAIICALGGAFAGRAKQSCENLPQYFKYVWVPQAFVLIILAIPLILTVGRLAEPEVFIG